MFTEIKSILKLLYRKNKPALFALAYLVTIIFIALFANIISPFNPNSQILELSSKPPMFKSEVLITSVYEKEKLIPIKKVLNIDSVNVKYLDYSSNEKLLFLSELKGLPQQFQNILPFLGNFFALNISSHLGRDRTPESTTSTSLARRLGGTQLPVHRVQYQSLAA